MILLAICSETKQETFVSIVSRVLPYIIDVMGYCICNLCLKKLPYPYDRIKVGLKPEKKNCCKKFFLVSFLIPAKVKMYLKESLYFFVYYPPPPLYKYTILIILGFSKAGYSLSHCDK